MKWDVVLREGLALGLAPAALWSLSVREWRALTAAGSGHGPGGTLDRAGLDDLLARFPDPPGPASAPNSRSRTPKGVPS